MELSLVEDEYPCGAGRLELLLQFLHDELTGEERHKFRCVATDLVQQRREVPRQPSGEKCDSTDGEGVRILVIGVAQGHRYIHESAPVSGNSPDAAGTPP